MTRANRLSPLLETLYAGLTEPEPWSGFLHALAEACGATYATLVLTAPDAALDAVVSPGANPERSDDYERLHKADPFVGLPEGEVVAFRDFVRDVDIARDFRVFLDLSGTGQILGVDLHAGSGAEARLRVTRDRSRRDFSDRERVLLGRLIPHLRIALGLYARLAASRAESKVFGSAIDRLAVATLILGPGGRILRRNAVAERLLADGGAIAGHGGLLTPCDPGARHRLARLLGSPPKLGTDVAFDLPAGEDHAPLRALARAVPATPYAEAGRGVLALFVVDPAQSRDAEPEALRDRFQLTRAEAALAARLADGAALPEAARALGVTHNTARAHLRAIFAKTGAHRQAQLVHLLRAGLAGFGADR